MYVIGYQPQREDEHELHAMQHHHEMETAIAASVRQQILAPSTPVYTLNKK